MRFDMAVRFPAPKVVTGALALIVAASAMVTVARAQQAPSLPLALDSARVSLAGTSNIHDYSATTTTVQLTTARLSAATTWDAILAPGAIETFEVAVPAASLLSDKDGLNKNMHKALLAEKHPNITFRLARLEAGANGAMKAVGTLQIAGKSGDMAFDLTTERQASALKLTGTTDLLMTDYGITPPKAMLGMLKTHPKVTVTFEALLSLR
jgi:polyisoprenoid-binding protein YceI